MNVTAKALRKPLALLRTKTARGLHQEQPVDRTGGDYGAGLIRGVAVVTRGEALGHDYWIDADFLQETAQGINRAPTGAKIRFTHPSLSGDGLGSYLGRAKNARVDGDAVLADVHFAETAHDTPDGDLADYVMRLAEEDPASFGTSIAYKRDDAAELKHRGIHKDARGNFRSPDDRNLKHLEHARLAELRAVDVVDHPAANPHGLFHRQQQLAAEADSLLSYALGLDGRRPELDLLGIDADRTAQFIHRFLDNHGLTVVEKEPDVSKKNAAETLGENGANETTDPKPTAAAPPADATSDPGATAATGEAAGDRESPQPASPADPAATGEPAGGKPETQQSAPAAAALKTGLDFLAAFGDQGGVWFAQGKTFDEAQQLYVEALKADNAALRQKLAAQNLGELDPLSMTPASDAKPGEKPAKGQADPAKLSAYEPKLGKTVAAIAAAQKIPGRD